MKIILNGQEKQCSKPSSLQEIIQQFCKSQNHIIAEVNGQIVKNLNWQNTSLKDGDKIELVSFVGGG